LVEIKVRVSENRKKKMNDFDNSLQITFPKSNLISWNNGNDEISQDISQINKIK
jgi:hypothetical protein